MKKHSIGSRILALLLTLVMVVSAIPTSVFAAIGDIGTGINAGKTGITAGTLNQDGAINWPVKIYDYLNDGMLFEPANSRADVASAASMVYGGGRVMPKTTLGTDYTVNAAFSEFAYTWTTSRLATEATGTSKGGNYVLTRKTAVRFEDPQYLHISYPGPGTYNMMMLRSFTNTPPSAAQTKADIRFMTIVYRANGIDSDERIDIKLESPSGTTYSYYGFADEDTNGADLVNTDTWKYLVIDLQAALDIRWESVASVTGVYLTSDMNDSGDYIDLSHVAFFSNVTEAAHYGEDAAAFSNDPGEYLVDSQTVTLAEGTPIYYTYPTDDEPGYDLGLNKTVLTLSGGQASSKIRFGMNFALGYAQSTATYARWASGATVSLNSGGLKLNSAQMNVSNTDNGNRDYVTLSSTASSSNIILSEFAEGADTGTTLYTGWNGDRVRYLVLVYRATGYNTSDQPDQMKFWLTGYTAPATPTTSANAFSYPDGTAATNFSVATYNNIQVADGWVSATIDLYTIAKQSYIKYVGMNFPTGTGKKLDLAYVGYFVDSDSASEFATSATAYMNQGIRVQTGTSGGESVNIKANRSWNMGNNLGYGLLFSSDGPGWTNLAGGNNTNPNGYYAYAIGYDLRNSTTTATSKAAVNANRIDFDGNKDSDSSSNIYLLKAEDTSDGTTADGYDMKDLTFDGYNLLQKVTSGWLTAGMLEGSLVDGKPVYRQETVEYLGRLLYNTLVIPPFDADGDYNYNFVKGEKSAQFAWDINGDNDLSDSFDLTGDGYAETSEASMDLATALRLRLGVTFTLKQDKGTYEKGNAALGTYEDTLTKADDLMGEFSDVREHIETCVDAAYFLLNNIFVDNSYNQLQDDYGYLVLSSAKVENSDGTTKDAYVFDAGFSTGTSGNETAAGYIEDSQSSLIYSPYVKEENGTAVVGNGTISLNNVNSKDMVSIDANGTSFTTRFPFLPVTDPEGDYPHDTETYYFADDGVRTYIEEGETYENRNYNYVLASNGEFVYYEDDNLFFDFEGDDDVYLFINGELVLDIGGAHGITKVSFNVNDYVEWARNVVDAVSAKNGDVSAAGYTDAEYKRAQKLNLTEGEICDFDFYYMERHGYGANCRIATNMHITDPSLDVGKQAYQFGDAVETGGVVDTSSSIEYSFQLTNTGNTKLYNLTFADDVIGVTLDPYAETADKALVIAAGSTAQDAHGGTLEAKDLTALVKSYKPVEGGKYVKDTTEGTYVIAPEGTTGTHDYVEIPVTFANETELWNFLKTLSGKGLETSVTDEEVTQSGSGLWVDSTVIIRGIYYKMTDAQIKEGVLNNTVYVTATTKISPASAGNKTLRSDASHRVYKSAAPVYYQWAGHELFVSGQKLLDDARTEANKGETSVLYQYATFLNKTTNASNVYFRLSDKTSYVTTYAGITSKTINGTWGYLINHQKPGTYSFYLTIFDKSMAGKRIAQMDADTYAFMRVTVYVTDTQDCTYVLDYGLQTEDLNTDGGLFANDELLGSSSDTTAKVMGITKTAPTYQNATTYTGDYNRLNLTGASTASKVEFDDGYITTPGATTIGYAGGKYTLPSAINFTPTKFMDGVYTMWMGLSVYSNEDIKKTSTAFTPSALGAAVDINNEVQMYKKITVLPATVVYYEDDFVGISYNKTGGNTFSHYGTGSGSLNQSVNQAQPYGQDKVYQDSSNSQYSGNSLSVFEIRNTTDVATFSFTGTGFELISRTNATDTATIVIGVYNQAEYASYAAGDTDKPTAVKLIPVITQFDNGNDGGDEAIYQVPTVRINDLTSGSYTVEISGNPTYDFSKWDGTTENLSACVLPTYLYIDGLRIYQPLGTSNDNYSDGENGAVFTELRSLIVEGKVAVAELSLNTLTVSTGTTTWTENLHDDTFDSQNSATYVGNKVGSSSDYLIQGPNNEVYMDGTVSNAAIVMYVQESGTGAHTLQIAARALDYAQFYGAETSGLKVKLQYGVKKADDSYDWEPLVTITSGTEQYYSIPYDQCPVVDGKYQVVIRAVNADTSTPAMVSYSTVKTVGLDIVKVDGNGEATDLYFQNGILVTPDYYLCGTINGTEVEAASDEAYRFAKGKLTVTFTADSTVAVARKLGTTVTQYKAGSTTLTATTTLTTANTNAITVPQGTYQFTLTENKDGTLTLTATAVVDTVDEEINDEIPTAMNMIAIKEQLSAGMPTGDTETEVILPTLELCYPTLAFEDEIQFNVYFSAIDTDDVVQMGLITFDSMLTEGTMEDALEVIPGFVAEDGLYRVHTNGIPAKNLGDVLHFKVYAQLSDGSYVYSDVACYSAVTYANRVLSGAAGDESVKPLVVAMLNYGAAAQQFFGYNTDALINAGLTAQEQAWVAAYDQSMVAPVTPADSSKLGDFASKGGFARQYPSISFEGAFSINYYFVPEHTVDGEMTFYYWSEEAYAAADALTAGNATKVVSITGSEYIGVVEGIAAKELDSTVYVAAVYKSDGTTYCTGVLAYSLGAYCVSQVNSSDPAMQTFAAATAVYGYCAKTYFAN